MSIFTYHLATVNFFTASKVQLFKPMKSKYIPGLMHAECMSCMQLATPILSSKRLRFRQVAVFAQWENEAAIEHFLNNHQWGKILAKGWHVRLKFMRQWGDIKAFKVNESPQEFESDKSPVVAVTLARMKPLEIPRFIRWGKPVEHLMKQHPGTTISLAAARLPNTISTFSIWHSLKDMTDMVYGKSKTMPQPKRHVDAMRERNRRDFHYEFTTFRFQAISEHGTWQEKSNLVPTSN